MDFGSGIARRGRASVRSNGILHIDFFAVLGAVAGNGNAVNFVIVSYRLIAYGYSRYIGFINLPIQNKIVAVKDIVIVVYGSYNRPVKPGVFGLAAQRSAVGHFARIVNGHNHHVAFYYSVQYGVNRFNRRIISIRALVLPSYR